MLWPRKSENSKAWVYPPVSTRPCVNVNEGLLPQTIVVSDNGAVIVRGIKTNSKLARQYPPDSFPKCTMIEPQLVNTDIRYRTWYVCLPVLRAWYRFVVGSSN